MSDKTVISLPLAWLQLQPPDVRSLAESERDALIVKAVQVNGQWLILSRYGDDIWLLDGFTSNTPESEKYLDFSRVPPPFRSVMKAIFYRYLRRGRRGQKRPSGSTILHYFKHALPFLRYL
ncbi:MAG: integrase, partial [Pseudomonas sp.]